MQIKKRTLPMYIFLNILTLGVYGFIVGMQMDREINAICKGDGQKPRNGYAIAVLLRFFVPVFGIIYYNYWWYQQANRLKLNAGRYGITVKESGTDVILMRTVLETPLAVANALEAALTQIITFLIALLVFAMGAEILAAMFLGISGLILTFFGGELTIGANISNAFMIKNLNRFADVYRNGAAPFNPMAYENYPSIANKYANFVPAWVNGAAPAVVPTPGPNPEPQPQPELKFGLLIGEKGSCAGYKFELRSGEEIIIGKDAKVSSVVIDPAYKEVSRKHVSVVYDALHDQYRVRDFSSNGTWANGGRMDNGVEYLVPRGSELKLANDKNIFRLG